MVKKKLIFIEIGILITFIIRDIHGQVVSSKNYKNLEI